ncbi:MAG: hypothetical protein J6U23_01275 [Clostridiales bacterium]|nr:hypothetical protein [Clostridiales bacterium]
MKRKILTIILCSAFFANSLALTACETRAEKKIKSFEKRMSEMDEEESEETSEEVPEDTSEETAEETTEQTTEETSEETENSSEPTDTSASETERKFTDVDIDLNDVKVLEAYSQLYDYNEEFEDLEIFERDDGSISMIYGRITDFTVDSPDEALIALYSIQKIFGCKDAFNEFVFSDVQSDGTELYYRFDQVHDSIPVYPGEVKIITDLEGNTTGFVNGYKKINISTEAFLDADDAIAELTDVKQIRSSELVIWAVEKKPVLAWKIFYDSTENGSFYTAVIDAKDGTIIDSFSNVVY